MAGVVDGGGRVVVIVMIEGGGLWQSLWNR